VLREVKNARFDRRLSLLGRRWFVVDGGRESAPAWRTRRFRAIEAEQAERPVALFGRGDRTYWCFEDRFYWEDDGLEARDVLALVRDRQRRRQRTLERAHAALAGESAPRRREPIPREVRLGVWERDGGRCVACGSAFDVQYDHVIPLALGGSNAPENLQILCAPCNQRKGAALG
jgi:5-methylcytosine-specific restriction endonuclease McrA